MTDFDSGQGESRCAQALAGRVVLTTRYVAGLVPAPRQGHFVMRYRSALKYYARSFGF